MERLTWFMSLWQLSILGVDCAEGHYDVECVCILILIFSGFVNVSCTGLRQKKQQQKNKIKLEENAILTK